MKWWLCYRRSCKLHIANNRRLSPFLSGFIQCLKTLADSLHLFVKSLVFAKCWCAWCYDVYTWFLYKYISLGMCFHCPKSGFDEDKDGTCCFRRASLYHRIWCLCIPVSVQFNRAASFIRQANSPISCLRTTSTYIH